MCYKVLDISDFQVHGVPTRTRTQTTGKLGVVSKVFLYEQGSNISAIDADMFIYSL